MPQEWKRNMNKPIVEAPAQCLCDVSRYLFKRELTELCGGNVSLRQDHRIYITPTCASQYFLWDLQPENVIVLEEGGSIVQGEKEALSRENELHLSIYAHRAETQSVFHLHTVELMLLAESPELLDGPLRDYLEERGIALALLDPLLVGQTPEHDDRLLELLDGFDQKQPAIIIGPRHGIFATAPDTATNFVTIDSLTCFLRQMKIDRQIRTALSCR